MSYLIDTDILIYSLKGNSTVTSNFMKHKSIPKSISVVSFGELVFGACKSQHPERNLATIRHLAELFPVIEISRSIMETFGEYKASLQKKGVAVADMDLLIAATALNLNMTLVTNNVKHFKKIPELPVENWSVDQ